jgi:magnesium transporter
VQRAQGHPPREEDTPIATSKTRAPRRSPKGASAPARATADTDRDANAETDATNDRDDRFRIRLFDADRHDFDLTFDEVLARSPGGRQLLWIDVTGVPTDHEADRIATSFELDETARRALTAREGDPRIALTGSWFWLRVAAEPDAQDPRQVRWLDIVAGTNVVITRHEARLVFLDEMDERIERDTTFGKLDAPAFVASLLEAVVTTYFRAVDAIEDDADDLDAVALRDEGRRALLEDLVAVRRRVAWLRRLLAAHRDVFASLAAADAGELTGGDSHDAFKAVAGRFESAVAAVDDAREAVLGSFDIYMTRTAQRTNDVMKVLAFATVLLLPGSLIAGLLGMNVTVPLNKDDPLSFWLVLTGVAILAVAVLGFARSRRWL